jgi:hypothetical protein
MTDSNPSGPDGPVPVALALLDQRWPPSPALTDSSGAAAMIALEKEPRFLIGRLQQALTTLLAADLPPMDSMTALLSAALADAIAWRHHNGRPCSNCGPSLCDPCNADWDQADRYHALAIALGAIGDVPNLPNAQAEQATRKPPAKPPRTT